jgi:vacuolar protein sorting-associated protein 13A/C
VSLPLGLDFIIRSAGVTLTEFQDVTFKLDCFERNMVLFTQEQLMWASLDHYKRQILKQFYAVVLGLDVIGNPVSLMMDLRQGVGDFFYEPFQGIIKGPEEAVEGLALGVASLFSHTVGGAIGAWSKISGTLGEGISSLTFDDELKKRRRQRRREQPKIALKSRWSKNRHRGRPIFFCHASLVGTRDIVQKISSSRLWR